ncbi:CHAD domain-containing protein [Trinickia violacea]|uniref:CHAD domain-containing protein n=1 Tax=Trinickia violacea TaxID=2571746 RepID=A0A4P8J0W5_9BURK|nr:CHAD domain-containing protein [Trinickia violacea]QCP54581.1 CHAD domain-containing protein [Trinickia violacea]
MSRVVEMSLDAPALVAREWMQQTVEEPAARKTASARAKRHASVGGVGEAMAEALNHVAEFSPQLSPVSARTPLTIYPLALSRKLAEAGWRALVEASAEGRRLVVSRRDFHSPAVTVREVVYDARLESGVPLAEQVSGLPSELRQALDAAGALASLDSVLQLQRTVWRWTPQDGRPVDVVMNDALDVPPNAMPQAQPRFCELLVSTQCDAGEADTPSEGSDGEQPAPESEQPDPKGEQPDLKDEHPDSLTRAIRTLYAAAQALVAGLPVFPVLHGFLERPPHDPADEEPARAIPVDLIDIQTPHAALIAIGANIAQQWFGNERGVRETATIEFVHQMRIAQRRLRTALRIFSGWADEDWTTRVEPELRWLGERLGEARDLDVFTDSTLPALAAADVDASTWSAVLAEADARRFEARARLQAAMRSRRYAQLSLAWLAWLAELPLRSAPEAAADFTLREFVGKRVRKHYKRLTDTSKLSELDAEARHRHRIEAKRLRYMLEFFESIASGRTRRDVARTLQRIQSVLGDGNDAVVALGFLEQLDITPYQQGFARGWSQAVNHCAAQEGERLLHALDAPRIKHGA